MCLWNIKTFWHSQNDKLLAVTLGLLFRISYRIVHDNIDESEVMITHTASL